MTSSFVWKLVLAAALLAANTRQCGCQGATAAGPAGGSPRAGDRRDPALRRRPGLRTAHRRSLAAILYCSGIAISSLAGWLSRGTGRGIPLGATASPRSPRHPGPAATSTGRRSSASSAALAQPPAPAGGLGLGPVQRQPVSLGLASPVERKQELVEPCIGCELGVEGDSDRTALPDRHRMVVNRGQNLDLRADLAHPWRADEHGMERSAV